MPEQIYASRIYLTYSSVVMSIDMDVSDPQDIAGIVRSESVSAHG
jgi:hypothetical protein